MSESTANSVAQEPLIVIVSGGGPVGLTFSLNLVVLMGKSVKIQIYEGRWFVDAQGITRWLGEEQGRSRRDQVVTLQDHVIEQMPNYIQQGLFSRINERVWPTSRNIPIREVEDRLFELLQPFVDNGSIELIAENLTEQSNCLIEGNFDVLVGTDGANSFVRRYCNIQMISEGSEYACGVAYNIPDVVSSEEEPLHQALNCILTVSQTRYLVNSSTSRRGFLNIRLIKTEFEALSENLQDFKAKDQAIDLLDYGVCPKSPIWSIIRQGLDFFKIPQKYVSRVIPIEINVRHASIVVRELRFELRKTKNSEPVRRKEFKTMLAFVAGDAAMNVHFWPGRGMNSGMKAAMALARNILRSCTVNGTIHVRKPLRSIDFIDYEGFMAKLRAREQQGRSLRVLVDPIDPHIQAAHSFAHLPHCYTHYTAKLEKKLIESCQRLNNRPEWPHKSRQIADKELEELVSRVDPSAVAQLSLANPWPTREMSGQEILVEDTFPFDVTKFLSVPKPSLKSTLSMPTQFIPSVKTILWITGVNVSNDLDELVKKIERSLKLQETSTSIELQTQLIVVNNSEQAKSWLQNNRKIVQKLGNSVKVISVWNIDQHETGVDAIRAVRSELARVPILIFCPDRNEATSALDFPNITTTDLSFELNEFVGIEEAALRNEGCRVSHAPHVNESTVRNDIHIDLNLNLNGTLAQAALPISAPTRTTTKSPPLLICMDDPSQDSIGIDTIRKKYPHLSIEIIQRYHDVKIYIKKYIDEIKKRSAFLLICHGFNKGDKKSCTDVMKLLKKYQLPLKNMIIFTYHTAFTKEKNPALHDEIIIAENRVKIYESIEQILSMST